MNPLISIITPVYNVQDYLVETINSVINQTYSNWELLLIDDGSTDQSPEICKQYVSKDKRIKYFSKENGGQASARNMGLKNSSGDYISFLDADDIYLPNKLEVQVDTLKNQQAEFYYGGGKYLYNSTKKIEPYNWIYGEFTGLEFYKILYHSCAVNINTVCFKRDLINKVGFFDENQKLRGTEDWDYWLRIALNVKTVFGDPNPLVLYRIHENGIHFQKANMLIGKMFIYEKNETSNKVHSLVKKREYRYIFRELFNQLYQEDRTDEISIFFRRYFIKDRVNIFAIIQWFLIKILPASSFNWISNKIIYRIAYRLEKVTYKIILNE